MQTVIETPTYLAQASRIGMTEADRARVLVTVAADPKAGDLIVGTGGARKIRIAGRGFGKSGGYRVITFFAAADIPVFLLDVYSKGDKANLTKAERNELAGILSGIADAYRAGAATKIAADNRKRRS
jgi:hypothetical protein